MPPAEGGGQGRPPVPPGIAIGAPGIATHGQGELSQRDPREFPDRGKVMWFREFRTKELPTFNTVKAVSFEICVLNIYYEVPWF